nr:retron Ec67 family RNA-directed DNA polymerase/endonuclease [Paracandidimonas lactea]
MSVYVAAFKITPPKTTLELFQTATSRAALASLLNIEPKDLTYLLYVLKDEDKYSVFSVPKRGGGERQISSPISQIKSLQERLADSLERCINDIELLTGRSNSASHGFRPEKSILTNASVHRNKRFVFNLDLEDFFPTITGRRIRGFLINDKNFKFHKDVATTIAHIACLDGKLPQGSPCSPVISNLIAGILDFHLARLAKACGCRYTRYADDITFSTNKKDFPKEIAFCDVEHTHIWKVGKQLRGLIAKSGFVINEKKTRMQYYTSRQQVTGLVVNKKINVTTEYRKLVRAYVFSLINHGKFTLKTTTKDASGQVTITTATGTRAQLHGMLGFIHSVDNVYRAEVKLHPYNYLGHQQSTKESVGNQAIYRRFLLYTRFYDNDTPLIVCEGKTDGVYISNAVHQSKAHFPKLLKKNDDGNDVLSFQLFKYARKHKKKDHVYLPNFSTASILGVGSGGGGNLGNLIRTYHKELEKFKTPVGASPVVFIVDNDDGGRAVYKVIKNILHITVSGHERFVHLFANLYIVPVPFKGSKDTSIEDLFSEVDISKGLNSRSFDFSKKIDARAAVGKADFAYEFVAKQAERMDWGGFYPLLQNICDALADYAKYRKENV